jgi:hypothetical protein
MGIAYIPHHIKDTYSDKPVYNSNNWLNLMGGTIGYRFQKENGLFVRVSYNHLATYNSLNSSTTQWSFKPFAGVALGYAF